MIYAVTGEPGAGKSRKCVSIMIDDLVSESAFVVTNEVLLLPRLRQYVCEQRVLRGIEEPFDLDENLLCLTPEMTFEFWRYRSGGLVLKGSPDREGDDEAKRRRLPKEQFLEFMETNYKSLLEQKAFQRPVHYFISETADYFDSQEWQTSGRAVKWYARKHRHLHDNVYFTAHNFDDVELRLRNLVSETIDLVNQTRMSIGLFKVRPVLKANYYFKMKTGGKTPFRSESDAIDIEGVCSCYNTSGAMGVHSTAEKKRNPGRLPWWSLYVAAAVGILLIVSTFIALPWMAGKGATKMLNGMSGSVSSLVPSLKTVTANPPPAVKSPSEVPDVVQAELIPVSTKTAVEIPKPSNPDGLSVVGVVYTSGKVSVTLSDGQVRTEEDGSLLHIGRSSVDLRDLGRVYFRRGAGVAPDKAKPVVALLYPETRPLSLDPVRGMGEQLSSPSAAAAPPQQSGGSWVTGSDGVSRLRESDHLNSGGILSPSSHLDVTSNLHGKAEQVQARQSTGGGS